MKTIATLIAVFLTCVSSSIAASHQAATEPPTLIVGLSPHLDAVARQNAYSVVCKLYAEPDRWNGRVMVYDALNCARVAVLDNNTDVIKRLPYIGRLTRAEPQLAQLRTFLRANTNITTGSLHFPEFMEHLATHVRGGNEPGLVLVLGSSLHCGKEKGYWMTNDRVPSGDHLLAGVSTTPFGCKDKGSRLSGFVIHWANQARDFTSDSHRKAVEGFWNAFVSAQFGILASASWDLPAVLERVKRRESAPLTGLTPPPVLGRLAMLKVIGDRLVPEEETTPQGDPVTLEELRKQIQELRATIEDLKKLNQELRASSDEEATKRIAAEKRAESEAAKRAEAERRAEGETAEANRRITKLEADLANQRSANARLESKEKSIADQLARATEQAAKDRAEREAIEQKLNDSISTSSRRTKADAQLLLDTLLAEGDKVESITTKRSLVDKALGVAVTNRLDEAPARARLEKLVPAGMPADLTSEILRVDQSQLPLAVGLDVVVETKEGEHHAGLEAKDFSVLVNGVPAELRAVARTAAEEQGGDMLSIVIAMDVSGSMRQGNALQAAKSAAQKMLQTLKQSRPKACIRVLAFADKATWLTDWSEDFAAATRAVDSLKLAGETALFEAVVVSTASLASRPGDRRLVVFTDGKNTVPSRHTVASLSSGLREAGAVPYIVGLKTADLDSSAMQSLAAGAGGAFRIATGTMHLEGVFGEVSRALVRRQYRLLVLLPKDRITSDSQPVTVHIGGGSNALRVHGAIQLAPVAGPLAEDSNR